VASSEEKSPLSDASDGDINRLVDDVLRSGKHLTMPAEPSAPMNERYHARAIAEQMHRLARHLSEEGAGGGRDEQDEWWFEVEGKRIGPLSLKKIRLLWEDGELTPDSLCWHEGFPKWVSLFKVSELAEALTPKLHVNVDAAMRAFAKAHSGEWASPAGSGMEAANRKRLESAQAAQAAERDPLPLSTPVNLADERAATYTALRTIDTSEPEAERAPVRPGGVRHALITGAVAGTIAAVAIVAVRVLWPTPVVQPIVISMAASAAPTPVAAPSAPAHPSLAPAAPVAPVAAAPGGEHAAQPSPTPPKPAEAKAEVKPEVKLTESKPAEPKAGEEKDDEKKPATVEEAFAKAFAEAPPDELTTGEVFEVVRAHKSQAEACANLQHAATPDATGKLVMRWTVEPDGHVSDVTAPPGEMSKSMLAECLAKEIFAWTFPKHALEHPPVEFPFKY
jgi:hypothetical protein